MSHAVLQVPSQSVKQGDPGSLLTQYFERSQQQIRRLQARFGTGAELISPQVGDLRELATLDLRVTKSDPADFQRYTDTVKKVSCKLSLSQEHAHALKMVGLKRASRHLVAYLAVVEYAVRHDTTLSDVQRRTKLVLGLYNLKAFAHLGIDVDQADIRRLRGAGVQAFGEDVAKNLFKQAHEIFETDKAASGQAKRVTRVSAPSAGDRHRASTRSRHETATGSSGRINKVAKPRRFPTPDQYQEA